MDALCDKLNAFNKEMEQQQNERGHAALDSMGSQIEARDEVGEFSKGQRIQASGISPIYLYTPHFSLVPIRVLSFKRCHLCSVTNLTQKVYHSFAI